MESLNPLWALPILFLIILLLSVRLHSLKKEKNVLEALYQKEREKRIRAEEKASLLDQNQKNLTHTFQSLSSEVLKKNSESFLALATTKFDQLHERSKMELKLREQSFDSLVKPIKESLTKVDHSHQELKKTLSQTHTSITEQVKSLATAQSKLQQETTHLVQALRRPEVRGRWGEMQLRRVVEISGMLEHCDFLSQPSFSNEDERQLRPDMLIQLPGNKHIIVDSKTPLQSYLDSLEVNEEEKKEQFLNNHAKQVRTHITQLSSKKYWSQFETTPEFVVLFLPGEPFFSAALQKDPSLIEFGVDKKVILATPTTLIALLRSAAYGWQQELIAKNAELISSLGKDLYDRIYTLSGHFLEIRKGLTRTVEAYNQSIGSLESRVLVTARKLKDAGITSKKELPTIEPVEKTAKALESLCKK